MSDERPTKNHLTPFVNFCKVFHILMRDNLKDKYLVLSTLVNCMSAMSVFYVMGETTAYMFRSLENIENTSICPWCPSRAFLQD